MDGSSDDCAIMRDALKPNLMQTLENAKPRSCLAVRFARRFLCDS